MAPVQLSCQAFAKVALHAVKYPESSVTGLLLGSADGSVVDSLPLFHHSQQVAPMAEVALAQADVLASGAGLSLLGYYAAGPVEANTRVADKLAEQRSGALLLLLDDRRFSLRPDAAALRLLQSHDGKWSSRDVEVDEPSVDCTASLIRNGAYRDLVDFDNHLDDISLDWTNNFINKNIQQLLEMDD